MGIKWSNVKVGVSPVTNEIYIGKVEKISDEITFWKDKSDDKTDEIVKAVMVYMLNNMDNKKGNSLKSGKTTLTISVEE